MTEHPHDLIELLEAEHARLQALFAQWQGASASRPGGAERQALVDDICLQLAIHARLEEELLQPLARRALGRRHSLDQAEAAHAAARELMCRVLQLGAQHPQQDAALDALRVAVERHVQLQRERVFPRLRRCGADLALLGRRLRERRSELESVRDALREDALVG